MFQLQPSSQSFSFATREEGKRSARLLRRLADLGPVSYLVVLIACLLVLFGAFRLIFLLLYLERLRAVDGFLHIVSIGLRFDFMTVALVCAPPALALLLLSSDALRRARFLLGAYALCTLVLALFLELASFGFLDEFDSRPNRLFLENLLAGRELIGTIWDRYLSLLVLVAVLVPVVGWLGWRASVRVLAEHRPWSTRRRLLALPVLAALLFVWGRGGMSVRAANRSSAVFSTSHLANELVPNSLYTLGCALLDMRLERSPEELYGDLPRDEVLERVRRWSRLPAGAAEQAIPLLHAQQPALEREAPYNLVLVLEESLGAQFVGSLGGLPLTPNLDALSKEALWFTQLYCTGTRTIRGLEATVCGFPPTPSTSVVKLGLSQENFFTVAALLKRHGYATDYLYGGSGDYDNMRNFMMSNGFETLIEQRDFERPDFVGTWGVSDEDLMRKANERFVAHGSHPFFALILSTSNHVPFEFPDGRIELYDAEKATRNNAVKYADHAIGELFRQARQEEYFARTVWIVVADHDTRAPSDDLIPLERFHIPGLILGPGVEPRHYDTIASQVDLMPTALHLLGLGTEHPMAGRNLFAVPPGDPGRALLQYYNVNGFLSGDRLVVHAPYEEPRQFRLQDGELLPAELDLELERDALAHVLLPWTLYREQRYRLP